MKKIKWILILINFSIFLGYYNYSIYQKEKIVNEGKLVFFALRKVDPRSLLQGDYMQLNYEMTDTLQPGNKFFRGFGFGSDSIPFPRRGSIVVTLDSNNVGHFVRIQNKEALSNNEQLVKYHTSVFGPQPGADAFFFQEGTSSKYDSAHYGALRVDKEGNSVLIGLYNRQLKPLH